MSTRNASLIVLLAFVAGCQAAPSGSGHPPPTSGPQASGPAASTTGPGDTGDPGDPAPPADMITGAGDAYLLDGTDGLETLASYTAALATTFEGTMNGSAGSWTSSTTYAFVRHPAAYQLVVTTTAGAPTLQPAWAAGSDGAVYARDGEGRCQASLPAEATDPGSEAEPVDVRPLDPAAQLPGFIGAAVTGTEIANGVAADVATLTSAALGWSSGTVEGTVAIAVDGGYVLRYDLAVSGGPELFGEGVTGKLTRHYALTEIGSTAVAIPAGCPAGLVRAPLPGDAVTAESLPGRYVATTGGSVIDTARLVRDGAAAFGWASSREPTINEDLGSLSFTGDGLALNVSITKAAAGSRIEITATRT